VIFHIFIDMIGIYKITSPTNKIYIGQSIDIDDRFRKYKNLNCNRQTIIYNSLKKYGWKQHTFEIIEECPVDKLLERETYWKEYYKVLEVPSLCCRIDGKGGYMNEDTKAKIGLKHKGKVMSDETKAKISAALKGRKVTWQSKGSKGYKYTEEQIQKMSKPRVNKWKRDKLVPTHIVEEIRLKYKEGYKKSSLGREYNVSWGTIKNITDHINSYK
jgi:group I intron endonuclease